MNTEKSAGSALTLTVVLLAAVIFSSVLFLFCYHWDNKYTASGPQPINGVLMLNETDLERSAIYLIRDWEIYRGKLLTPEDFHSSPPLPDELVFIGQYGGFEGHLAPDGISKNPHGSATYRLNIALPDIPGSYTLELPEIYSAYTLYINGVKMKQMGDPLHYRAETGNSHVTVQASKRLEILIAVSDYSHFYSGMVHPPAFGNQDSVMSILNTRFGLRVAVLAVALCIGLLYLCVWIFTKKDKANNLPILYSVLCLCFVLNTCHPVVKTMFSGVMCFYSVENVAYCAMFLLAAQIQRRLTGVNEIWWKPVAAFGIFVCCWSLLVPLFLGDSLTLMMAYSGLINIYAWICAGFLTVSAVIYVLRGKVYSVVMLAGVIVFDTALIEERLLPVFEPIRFGWFTELACGILVLAIGIVLALEVARQFRQRQAMEIEVIENRISVMLSQIQPHFLYNSLTAISGLCSVDPERAEDALNDFSHYLRKNLDALGSTYLVTLENELEHLGHYLRLEKMRFGDKINVVYDLEVTDILIPPLTVQSLAENAVRYGITKKPGGGTLTIATRGTEDSVVITVSDDGLGFADNAAPDTSRRHVGIEYVKIRLKTQVGGMLSVESKVGEGTVCTIAIPK